MNTVYWLVRTIKGKCWMVLGLSAVQGILAVSGIAFALLMRRAIDGAVAGQTGVFTVTVIWIGLLILAQAALRALNRYTDERARAVVENCLRSAVFHGIMKKDYKEISGYHTGELMNRITSDAAVAVDAAVSLVPSLASMALRILGVLVTLYVIEPWLAAVFLTGGCLIAVCSFLPRKWLKRMHKRVQEADGVVRCFLQECMESLLIIHAFGCERKMEKIGRQKMDAHKKMRAGRSNVSNLFSTLMNLGMQCGYLFGFVWCGYGILQGRITYGTLTAVIQLIGQIQTPFASLGGTFPKAAAMLASGERLMELSEGNVPEKVTEQRMQEQTVQEQTMQKLSAREIYGQMEAVDFRHVSFGYEADAQVLKDETFRIYKGEFAALVGASGIGKSTVMKLLLSAYTPDSGEICVCMPDQELPVHMLPSGFFAYVPQGLHLMSGTIRQVVGFAEPSGEIDDEKVKAACRTACAHEYIAELPRQYDTMLGERGTGLSEGQMQRLAIARAIYSGCPVLLLDEATSALDADTEKQLIINLKKLTDRTILLITHRREAWELCDRILERKDL